MGAIQVKTKYSFIEHYIPPRCRKERTREAEGFTDIFVPTATKEDAPVAFKHKSLWFPQIVTYRWWNDGLYARIPRRKMVCGGEGYYTLTEFKKRMERKYTPYCEMAHSEEEAISRTKSLAEGYLVIEGELWETVGEPRYVIHTFGLGHNHASTSLSITNHYNGNISGNRYFTALEFKEAVKEAVRIAVARGDTDSVERIRKEWKIHVHIPEAVRCRPKEECGPGDPFLNKLDTITELAGDQTTAAVLAMTAAVRD